MIYIYAKKRKTEKNTDKALLQIMEIGFIAAVIGLLLIPLFCDVVFSYVNGGEGGHELKKTLKFIL